MLCGAHQIERREMVHKASPVVAGVMFIFQVIISRSKSLKPNTRSRNTVNGRSGFPIVGMTLRLRIYN